MTIIAPSLLAADFARLGEEIRAVEAAGADWLHLDVMDGHFVPNITFGPHQIKDLKRVSRLPFDVHLMIERPDDYIDDFAQAGADIITVHAEVSRHLHRSLQKIKEQGLKAGVSLNPASPLSMVEEILPQVDLVLLMSVNPGFGGQQFIPSVLEKVRRLAPRLTAAQYLQVDGGVNAENGPALIAAGANCLVIGTAFFKAPDRSDMVRQLHHPQQRT